MLRTLDVAVLDEAAGARSVASYGTQTERWSSLGGIFCGEDRSVTVDVEIRSPEDERFRIELAYEYTADDSGIIADSTSVNAMPGDGPWVGRSSITEMDADIDGSTQVAAFLRLAVLSTDAL